MAAHALLRDSSLHGHQQPGRVGATQQMRQEACGDPVLELSPRSARRGVPAQAVTTGEELTAALRDAAKADGPRLVEVPIGQEYMPLG